MALPARFSLLNSKLDAFLFASIGEEESGMPLSVASALARLGNDPWVEAEKLTAMPRAIAAETLASMIAKIPMANWKPSDASAIAATLIQLLPGRVTNPSKPEGTRAGSRLSWPQILVWLICLGLIAFTAFKMLAG
jgi:hypothetical protein